MGSLEDETESVVHAPRMIRGMGHPWGYAPDLFNLHRIHSLSAQVTNELFPVFFRFALRIGRRLVEQPRQFLCPFRPRITTGPTRF